MFEAHLFLIYPENGAGCTEIQQQGPAIVSPYVLLSKELHNCCLSLTVDMTDSNKPVMSAPPPHLSFTTTQMAALQLTKQTWLHIFLKNQLYHIKVSRKPAGNLSIYDSVYNVKLRDKLSLYVRECRLTKLWE